MKPATFASTSEPRLGVRESAIELRQANPLQPRALPVATRSQLLKEYCEACANMRHYGNARLTRLVMFLALNGGLLNLLFNHQATMPRKLMIAAEVAALLATVLFGIVDHNIVVHFRWFNARARQVESIIGLLQYTFRQERRDKWPYNVVNETNATYLMYATVFVFWGYCVSLNFS